MAELGLKTYRMSFSRCRIMPSALPAESRSLVFYDGLIDLIFWKRASSLL